ncbi:hypothetical protein JCM19237_325 [Photobacterium aphoticum]|uniref:Uncharacterized protein n=1 Tax=Photobacterium aphoticum TaxID=754436 RepID=A0A090QXM4_9GAMM|nr:hypothetical protein JCM19237_325 [Photobacterium aphoticum]
MAAKTVGVTGDDGVHDSLKVAITQDLGNGPITVIGYMLEGSNFSLSSAWEAPLTAITWQCRYRRQIREDLPANDGTTFKTQFNSQSIWEAPSRQNYR